MVLPYPQARAAGAVAGRPARLEAEAAGTEALKAELRWVERHHGEGRLVRRLYPVQAVFLKCCKMRPVGPLCVGWGVGGFLVPGNGRG